MYDYVVVGAGSAGAVIASRLTEDPEVSVALIEAGSPDTAEKIHLPVAFPALFKGPYDWDLDTEPEPSLYNRRIYLPRGKTLGGSSSMNAMIYIRGNRADYDEWASGGATGWEYDDVLPYFKLAEGNERGEDDLHGAGGPLPVSEGRSLNPLGDSFLDAAEQAGYLRNPDFNGTTQLGVGRYQVTQRNGMRASTAVAYLHPVASRPNLTILTNASAENIVFEGRRAVGVRVRREGTAEEIRASREVILSAGAYGSPHLLLLSGVGPADQLAAFQIDVLQDLPVGQNLQDHPAVFVNFLTDRESLMTALTPDNLALLQNEGRGPLTSNIGEAGGFVQTRPGPEGVPDIQLHQAPVLFRQEGLGAAIAHGLGIGPCVLKPSSRGSVTLRSTSPGVAPRITHNYYTAPEDLQAQVAGVRIVLEIARQPALKSVITGSFSAPASEAEADIVDFIRRNTHTLYHPTSTCAIGAVVDERLRVHGIDGLRVADASVMPTITRGNTNAPTIMIGEKAAAMIREDAHIAGASA